MSTENRNRIADNFGNTPEDLYLRDTRPVIEPAWEVSLDAIAKRVGDAVASNDLSLIPAAGKLDAGQAVRTPRRRDGKQRRGVGRG